MTVHSRSKSGEIYINRIIYNEMQSDQLELENNHTEKGENDV